jgi:hypothetical protein
MGVVAVTELVNILNGRDPCGHFSLGPTCSINPGSLVPCRNRVPRRKIQREPRRARFQMWWRNLWTRWQVEQRIETATKPWIIERPWLLGGGFDVFVPNYARTQLPRHR